MSKKRGPEQTDRRKVAEAAGLSRAQTWRALQVASIPEEEFDAMVDGPEAPPTVAELVRVGRGENRSVGTKQPRRLKRCPHCGGDLTELDSAAEGGGE